MQSARTSLALIATIAVLMALTVVSTAQAPAQKKASTIREFLLQYKGKEILIQDRTGGVEQFVGGDATKAYNLTLNDVQTDYMIVSRNTDTDKRTFLYPLSLIRRIIYLYDGKPYQKIVIEFY